MEKTNCRAGGLARIKDTEKYCVRISNDSCKIVGLDPRETACAAVRRALEKGKAIVAVIEKNGIKGLPVAEREVKRAERQGNKIKLIYGTRISAFDGKAADGARSMFTVILISVNKQGYRNLCEIITLAYAAHYTDKPAVPYEEIVSRGEGLICLDDFDSDAFELSDSGLEKIAKKIEETQLFPMVRALPVIEGASESLKDRCFRRAHDLYGDKLPTQVETRLSKEMDAIIGNGYAPIFSIAQMMTDRARSDKYPVGFRGPIGSSLAAFFAGITEVNPLPPHYICPECGLYEEPQEENRIETCWELPEKCCPECGSKMRRDGYDIPPETLFGYRMDREPDIDLNFAPEYRDGVHQLLVDHFGADRVVTPGICRSDGKTGYHPWGAFIVPENYKITDFTPLQKQTLYPDEDKLVTHLDYHDADYPLLKVDMLEHKGLHMLKVLEEETGILAEDIPLDDKDTLEYLTYAEGDISECDMNGYNSLIEFGSGFARQVIHAASPHSFADLVRVNGLIHGTDVWKENAELFIADGTARLRDVITTRDDIMNYMLEIGMDRENAYKIMDIVRKGRALKPEQVKLMRDHGVPEWYIESCGKIVYVFPRAHAVVYTMMAFRLAWYKVHYTEAYT